MNKRKTYIFISLAAVVLFVLTGAVVFLVAKPRNAEPRTLAAEHEQTTGSGTLSLNTDKDNYLPGEMIEFEITSLDDQGNKLCDSDLELMINNNNIPVESSATCGADDNSPNPDYFAVFTPNTAGEYKTTLTNNDNGDKLESTVKVSENIPNFSIKRWGANRISNSDVRYPMKLIVSSQEDFQGQVVETVPGSIEIIWYGPAKVKKSGNRQTLTWDVDLNAGEKQELSYEYTLRSSEDQILNLGTAKMLLDENEVYQETRPWQVIVSNN